MTNLKEQLHTDLTAAIKAKDSLTSGTLRMVLAAITNEEVSGKEARVLNDQDMVTVLNREAKKRKEAATAYDDAKRPELADKERAELEIIQPQTNEGLMQALLAADATEVGKSLVNDLQAAACSLRPALRLVLDVGQEYGALGAIV